MALIRQQRGRMGRVRPSVEVQRGIATAYGSSRWFAFWRGLALHAAVPPRPCSRESLGLKLRRPENARIRCGFQPRADEHVDALGGVCRIYVSAAAPSLVREFVPSEISSAIVAPSPAT
jgi:hypothetical protein